MSRVFVTFDMQAMEKIEQMCDNMPCIECPFGIESRSDEDTFRCYLEDVSGRRPCDGWNFEDADRMEDDLR